MIVLPSSPFPSTQYLAVLVHAGIQLVIDEGEHYVKQSLRNRFEILTANGPSFITIPVEGQKGVKIPVKNIRIAPDPWQKHALRSIRSAYGRSPYFIHYEDELEELLLSNYKRLSDFNMATLEWITSLMGIAPKWSTSSEYFESEVIESDYRRKVSMLDAGLKNTPYSQVFEDRFSFQANLSSLDLLMNVGPESLQVLNEMAG